MENFTTSPILLRTYILIRIFKQENPNIPVISSHGSEFVLSMACFSAESTLAVALDLFAEY